MKKGINNSEKLQSEYDTTTIQRRIQWSEVGLTTSNGRGRAECHFVWELYTQGVYVTCYLYIWNQYINKNGFRFTIWGKKWTKIICTRFICRNTSFIVKINQFWHTKLTEFIHIRENVNEADKYMSFELFINR